MGRQTDTDTQAPVQPFEYRPEIERVCSTCGWKFVGFTCPGCGHLA